LPDIFCSLWPKSESNGSGYGTAWHDAVRIKRWFYHSSGTGKVP